MHSPECRIEICPEYYISSEDIYFLNYVGVHSSAAKGHFEHSLDVSTLHNSQNCA